MSASSQLSRFPQDFIFREAQQSDAQEIQLLFRAIHEEYGFDVDFSERDIDLVEIENHYSINNNFLGVLIDNQHQTIAGSVGLKNKQNGIAELCRLYLRSSYRGIGLGKHLLSNAIKIANDLNYKKVVLETHSSMREAVKLYEKAGFQQISPFSSKDVAYCDYASELLLN